MCAVGIRSSGNPKIAPNTTELQDSWIQHIYAHDDNVGPNVRFRIDTGAQGQAVLALDAPPPTAQRTALKLRNISYDAFVPERMIVAVHNDLRTSVDTVHKAALLVANRIGNAANSFVVVTGGPAHGITASARFIRISEYLGNELHQLLGGNSAVLSKTRLALTEQVRPMSLHLGVVRVGDHQSTPLMDILYDTTDSDRNHPVFANVAFSSLAREAQKLVAANPATKVDLGIPIDAF